MIRYSFQTLLHRYFVRHTGNNEQPTLLRVNLTPTHAHQHFSTRIVGPLTRSHRLRKAWMPKRRWCAVGRDSSLIFRRILSGEPPPPPSPPSATPLTPAPSSSSSSSSPSSPLYIIIRARLASIARLKIPHPAGKFSPNTILLVSLEDGRGSVIVRSRVEFPR